MPDPDNLVFNFTKENWTVSVILKKKRFFDSGNLNSQLDELVKLSSN